MKRRDLLKGLGLSLGYVVATPTVLNILQSCKNEVQTDWIPQFFSVNESVIVKNIVNLILPKTKNLPGALELNVPEFIDAYLANVVNIKQQKSFKKGMSNIKKILGKSVKKLTIEDYDNLLVKFLKASNDELEQFTKNDDNTEVYEILTSMRTMSIWAYKTSEKIGEEILAYDPVPGKLQGCISLEEATSGRSWSL